MSAPDTKTPELDELAELEKRAAERAKAREGEERKRRIEVLKLEAKFEEELGPRGSMFEIVETVEGPIVVRLGEGVLFQRFTASKVTPADVHNFVYPCVEHPTKERYVEIVANRPEVAGRCAHALMSLFGAKNKDDAGKF